MTTEQFIDGVMECAQRVQNAQAELEQAVHELRKIRQQATDLIVDPEMEDNKRNMIAETDTMILISEGAVAMIQTGPVAATEFRDELVSLLTKRAPEMASASSPTVVAEILLERANQAAQLYQGRIVADRT